MMRTQTGDVAPLTLADLHGVGAPAAPEVKKPKPPVEIAVEAVPRAVPAAAVERHEGKMAAVEAGVVRMETEDPDVVIYWVLEGSGD